jgi:ABC-2 type transport system ATP-binding protein
MLLTAEKLEKRYGAKVALAGIDVQVAAGEVVGFLGPNGAGKSTTMRILAGVIGADGGRVVIDGHDLADDPIAAKAALGYLPEAVPLYPELRVVEYLAFRAELKGVLRKYRVSYIEEAMQKARVTDVAYAPIGTLSKGYRQRVGLADALVAKPKLLLLDEPTAGLDPAQIVEVREVLRGLGPEHGVLLSTHILSEVEAVADRAIVIDHGKVVAAAAVTELRAADPAFLIGVSSTDVAMALLKPFAGRLVATVAEGGSIRVALVAGSVEGRDGIAEEVVAAFVGGGVGVRSVVPERPRLEEVFLALTRSRVEQP